MTLPVTLGVESYIPVCRSLTLMPDRGTKGRFPFFLDHIIHSTASSACDLRRFDFKTSIIPSQWLTCKGRDEDMLERAQGFEYSEHLPRLISVHTEIELLEKQNTILLLYYGAGKAE